MTYQSEKMSLAVVMDVYHGAVNDVIICENEREKGTYYTVLKITAHQTVKQFLTMLEQYPGKRDCVIDMFSCENGFLVVMGYCRQRSLKDFYRAGVQTVERAEQIGINLVAECIGSPLPYPLLELVLKEQQVHLRQDDGVALGYMLNLEALDPESKEPECAHACAKLVRELIAPVADRRTVSLQLLDKKLPLRAYHTFRELYRDLGLSSKKPGRRGLIGRIHSWCIRNQERIFRALLWISVFLLILVLLMVLSNVVFGDIPFMRIFFNSFQRVGTESMLQ